MLRLGDPDAAVGQLAHTLLETSFTTYYSDSSDVTIAGYSSGTTVDWPLIHRQPQGCSGMGQTTVETVGVGEGEGQVLERASPTT